MRNFNRGSGYNGQSNNNRRSFSNSSGSRGQNRFNQGRGGRKQATFDPTHVILSSNINQSVDNVAKEEYVVSNQFSDFSISEQLKKNIAGRGYTTPTPIQDQIIPYILEGRDVVGIANTGTGKTAAFLIPLLDKIAQNNNEKVLIIAPTRELAVQIRDELMSFSNGMRVYSTLCIGGASMYNQIDSLRRGQHFVIGTPGRIKDLSQRGKLRFDQFTNIVLDEVDRMLDMGFVREIREIIDALPEQRQSLFFSATMTEKVKDIMKGFLYNPAMVTVKSEQTSAGVKQELLKMKGRSKLDVLHELLQSEELKKVLIFGRTKRGAERLSRDLQDRGHRVGAIHGNKSQGQRQRALKDFRNDRVSVLVATDVVSRGLDIDNITHVINFDLPESYEDYIHRIGRTGRAQKTGVAITLVN